MSLWESGEIISKDKLNLKTLYIGEEPPPNPVDGMVWVDISSTPYLVKVYRGGSWDVARGADVDRVTAPPAAASDYQTPLLAAASSPTSLQQTDGSGSWAVYSSSPRAAQKVYASYIGGHTITQVDFLISKTGSPTGGVYFRIRRRDNDSIIAELGYVGMGYITTTPTWWSFSGSWNMPTGVDILFCVEFSGGDSSNYVNFHMSTSNVVPWGNLAWSTSTSGTNWSDAMNHDGAIKIYSTLGFAAEAIDDDVDTYWQPDPPNQTNAWIRFDLGSVLAGVAGCRAYWPSDANYRPQAYKIQASVDGSSWDDLVVENTQPPAGWVEYSWMPRPQTRYLRIFILQHGSSGTRVNEFDYYQSNIWRHGHRGD